jgi:hypothetical protein
MYLRNLIFWGVSVLPDMKYCMVMIDLSFELNCPCQIDGYPAVLNYQISFTADTGILSGDT